MLYLGAISSFISFWQLGKLILVLRKTIGRWICLQYFELISHMIGVCYSNPRRAGVFSGTRLTGGGGEFLPLPLPARLTREPVVVAMWPSGNQNLSSNFKSFQTSHKSFAIQVSQNFHTSHFRLPRRDKLGKLVRPMEYATFNDL